jgi:hypothetical protein
VTVAMAPEAAAAPVMVAVALVAARVQEKLAEWAVVARDQRRRAKARDLRTGLSLIG